MVTFMLGKHLVFVERFQFMSSSLDKLVSNLSNDAFKCTSEEIKNAEKLKLMNSRQKGAHPYDYVDSFNRCNNKNYQQKMIFTAY